MKKRFISIILALTMLYGLMPVLTAVAEGGDAADAQLTITREGGKVTAAYTGVSYGEGDRIILAAYDTSGAARDVRSEKLTNTNTVSLAEENGRYYKAFAFDPDTMLPLCDSALDGAAYSGTVEVPMIDGAMAESVTAAVRRYGDARVLVEELAALDISEVTGDSKKLSEYMAKVNEAIAAYDDVMQSAAVLNSVSEKSIEKETAELSAAADEVFSVQATKDEQFHWAEEFTQRYDSIKGKDKLKQLAQMMGVDAVEAYSQLVASQNILRGKYMDDAATADAWVKGLTAVKTGSKVGLVVCATIATAGAGGATLTGATGIWLGTADAVIDVGKTGATIIYGDESKVVKDMDNFFKPVSTASTIFSILTFNSASLGEQLACIFDTKDLLNETVNNYTGYTIDDFTNIQFKDGKLYADLISKVFSDEEIDKIVKDPKNTGKDGLEELSDGKDRLNKDRDEITDEKVEEILKDGDVLNEDETLDDFKDEQKEFEKEMKEESLKEDEEETPEPTLKPNETPKPSTSPTVKPSTAPTPTPTPTVTYHEEVKGSHLYKYYYNHEIDGYVGLYEDYCYDYDRADWALVVRRKYDDDGVIQFQESYDLKGRLTHYYTYTDGYNVGSVWTHVQYYNEEYDGVIIPEGVTEQMKYVDQYKMTPYTDENGEEKKTWEKYFGEYRYYDVSGVLLEHSTGIDGQWYKTEGFDGQGVLSYDYINNLNGTYTFRSYYTQKPSYWKYFNPTGHIQALRLYKNGVSALENGVPIFNENGVGGDVINLLRSEDWELSSQPIKEITNSEGDSIGYYAKFGYGHSIDGEFSDFIAVTGSIAVYY